jgi:hypothetical protein
MVFFAKNNLFLVFRYSKHTSYKQEEFAQKQSKDRLFHQTKMTFSRQGFYYSFSFPPKAFSLSFLKGSPMNSSSL